MQNRNIDEDTGTLYADKDDELEDKERIEAWQTRKIGKLNFRSFPMAGSEHRSLFEAIRWWWWNLCNVFNIAIKVGLSGLEVRFWIFGMGFTVQCALPRFKIILPFLSKIRLDWLAWKHIGKHKGWEIQTWREDSLAFGIDAYMSMHTDHYGLFVELDLLFFHINLSLYDGRHWDYEKHRLEEWLEEEKSGEND